MCYCSGLFLGFGGRKDAGWLWSKLGYLLGGARCCDWVELES
jgi:hypothetical protein